MAARKIQSMTTIRQWAMVEDKEKIDFELLDFSPEQVAQLDRWVRHPEDKLQLTIEAEQKKLQLGAVTSLVRLVSSASRAGGQKVKVAGFTTTDSRAQAMKALVKSCTPVMVTFEQVQGRLEEKGKDNAVAG